MEIVIKVIIYVGLFISLLGMYLMCRDYMVDSAKRIRRNSTIFFIGTALALIGLLLSQGG